MSIGITDVVQVYKYNKSFLDLSFNERIIYFKNIKSILKKLDKIKKDITNEEFNILYNVVLANIFFIR
jgi:hypothetical protein